MTKVAIPTAPSELEELLTDSGKMKAILADPDSFKAFIGNYARTFTAADNGELLAQIGEQTQAQMRQFLVDNGYAKTPTIDLAAKRDAARKASTAVATGRGAAYNKAAPGARLDDIEFDGPADFFQAIWHRSQILRNRGDLAEKLAKLEEIQNSFGSEVPADGGFLIPETLRSEILQVALESAIVRPRARVIPMDSLRVPIPSIDSTSNASSVYGGVVAYWTEEAAALTESSASFGRVVLDAKKLTAYAEMPNELIADAPAFGAFFGQTFPQAMAFYEDYAFARGSGTGEPLGFVNAPAVATVAAEAGQASGTLVWENVVKMYSRMLPSSLGNAEWIASIDTFPELATMALSVGTGGSAVWLNNGVQGPPMTILGRPVTFTEKMPALGTTGDICFADLSYYLIGDRQQMQAMSSPHFKFGNDKTAFRVISRVDGRPWLQSAITPKNSSATLSPFVQLATR